MHFSVVGNLVEAISLLKAVDSCSSANHVLAVGFVSGELKDRIAETGLPLRLAASAEDVVVDQTTDVVVVAASQADESVYLARQASQADCHVIVVPPKDVSTAFSYELHLLLDESRCGLIVLSGRWYADIDGMPAKEEAAVRQLALSLRIPSPLDASLERAQLYAVDALCGCGFPYSQVTAIDVRAADDALLCRTITLAASDVSESKLPPATLLFSGKTAGETSFSDVRVSLDNSEDRTLGFIEPWVSGVAPRNTNDRLKELPDRLADSLTSPERCQRGMEQFSNTLELLAGIEKSLRRRRTVDVYFEGASERGVFKSQMTALGCGVLAYVSLGMVAYLMLAQLGDFPAWVLQTARILWIAPVVIFLILQFLLPITRDRSSNG